MNTDLTDKTALVCGSTQGIGQAAAHQLAALGATVLLLARSEEALQRVAQELPVPAGQTHAFHVADFGQPQQVDLVGGEIAENRNVEILVNNTGGPSGGSVMDAAIAEFERAFQSHLVCNQMLTRALVPGMKRSGYGRIINVISTSVKQPIPGLGVSNTIRGAVANWAKTLAAELGPFGITVNNVLPGFTDTQRLHAIIQARAKKEGTREEQIIQQMKATIPLRRFAEANELGSAIAFLASPCAGYISGINLPVDGGRTSSL